jgi:NAD(P)-dependent dehydrogenase (short-subunit alcohol dehydrogenase family)
MAAAPIVTVLTGCTRGLGRALTQFLIDNGATVAGCGRNAAALEQMRAEFGPAHDFSPVDIGDDRAVAAWARRVVERFGAPRLLINNAAVIAPNSPIWKVSAEDADAVLGVNIAGTINTLRHFVPAMISQKAHHVIINLSSGWGRSTSPNVGIYCASKWAIEGLTQSLAQDLAHTNIHAYALNPGVINTEMLQECFGSSASGYPTPAQWVRQAGPFILRLLDSKQQPRACSINVSGIPLD